MYILIALLARLGRFFLPPLIHFITLHSSLLLIRVFVCLFSFLSRVEQQKRSEGEAAVLGPEKVQHGSQEGDRIPSPTGTAPEHPSRRGCFLIQVYIHIYNDV